MEWNVQSETTFVAVTIGHVNRFTDSTLVKLKILVDVDWLLDPSSDFDFRLGSSPFRACNVARSLDPADFELIPQCLNICNADCLWPVHSKLNCLPSK